MLEALRERRLRARRRRSSASRRTSPPTAVPSRRSRVNSGTSALHLALLAAGIGPGDEVITVPMTFVATVAAIVYAGATPVLRRRRSRAPGTMDPARHRGARSRRAPRRSCRSTCTAAWPTWPRSGASPRRHGLVVIEDAAQAHGASADGRARRHASATIGCFSFYPGKNLGACGEGGAVVTNDAALADRMRSLRDWGQEGKLQPRRHGFNYRMDGVQGAVLGGEARRISTAGRRRAGASRSRLRGAGSATRHRPRRPARSAPTTSATSMRSAPTTATRLRAEPRRRPASRPASTIRCPVHLQPAYADLGHGAGRLPGRRGARRARPSRCRSIPS